MMINQENENKPDVIYDCVVVGAGISGISFAHKLSRTGKNVLVLEKENAIGGQVNTHTSLLSSDFWTELGAHTCYNSYTHLLSIIDELEISENILPLAKCSYMLYDKEKIKSPFSEIAYIPLIFNGLRFFSRTKKNKTVKEYFRPIVGAGNYDKLFSKMFRAVICQDADEYPAEIFLKKRKNRRNDIVRKFSFSGGLSSLLTTIADASGISTEISAKVVNIIPEGDLFRIETADGKVFKAYNIALATNPHVTARILQKMEPEIANLLETIPLFRSETFSVIIHKNNLDCAHIAGIIPTSDQFLSVVSRDVSEHTALRGFTFHFEHGKTDAEKLNTICNVLNIKPELILEKSTTSHVLPALRKQHVTIIEDIEERRRNPHIYLLGNYFYGLSIEDCVHRSYDEYERFVAE